MSLANDIQQMGSVEFWIWTGMLGGLAATCLYVAFAYIRRSRLIEDTPTAKVRSAAQGYVELDGTAREVAGKPLIAPLTDTLCCWYRYEVQRKAGKNWRTIDKGSSDEAFILEDDTGRCLVLPHKAEITPTDQSVWYGATQQPTDRNPPRKKIRASVGGFRVQVDSGFRMGLMDRFRYTEERIYAGDPVYALGHFKTLQESDHQRKKKELSNHLLNLWKQDQQSLLARFDRDGDGSIDMREWDEARQAARRIASDRYETSRKEMIVHTLSRPSVRSQPFLISTLPQFDLSKRYHYVAVFLLVVFFLFGTGSAFFLSSRYVFA